MRTSYLDSYGSLIGAYEYTTEEYRHGRPDTIPGAFKGYLDKQIAATRIERAKHNAKQKVSKNEEAKVKSAKEQTKSHKKNGSKTN